MIKNMSFVAFQVSFYHRDVQLCLECERDYDFKLRKQNWELLENRLHISNY